MIKKIITKIHFWAFAKTIETEIRRELERAERVAR